MKEAKLGIKETKEILVAMGEAAVSGKKALAVLKKIKEGGITPADIIHISELIAAAPDMSVMEAGIEDADKAMDEMKDLDQAEVIEFIGVVYAQAKRFNEA